MNSPGRIILFCLLEALGSIALFGCDDDEGVHGQLIVNGDVETGSMVPNSWWSNSGQNKYEVTWTDQESFSASKSLKISAQSADPVEFAFWAQTISVNIPTGKTVKLTVKVKGTLSGQGVSIAIRGDNTPQPSGSGEQFATTQGITPISGSFDWMDHSVQLPGIDANTQSLTIYLIYLSNTTGEVYFDDVSLTF
jgi:hypothetical protein